MRQTLIFGILLFSCALASGQSFGPFSLTGSQCASVSLDRRATVAYYVLGSWTGTIQPQVAVDGQPAANAQTIPSASTTPQATVTANGAYFSRVAGYSLFLICGNTITGTATLYINASPYGH